MPTSVIAKIKEILTPLVFTQLAITCSKLTIETVKQSVKYVQNWLIINDLVLVSLLLTLNIFYTVF